ncbi:lysophospholipid acyltransferase family protein [Thermogutta sp.]|uniref:lysophospholipid acyltransferase family protein n=1 Tax=Thermogutta sp. TaxID=1962930 RepID=UPI00321FC7B8
MAWHAEELGRHGYPSGKPLIAIFPSGMKIQNARQPHTINPYWYEFSRVFVRLWAALMFRIRYFGVANVPREGALLVVSNHQSHLDPPLIGAGIPRTMHYLARKSLFRFPGFAQLIRSYGAIPLDLNNPLSGLKEALACLQTGEAVLIFPEGTRSPDGELHPFHKGFRMLAIRSRARILPTAIEGAFAAWPKWRSFPRPGRVAVRFGFPLTPDEYLPLDEDAFLTLVEDRVRECLWELRSTAFPVGVPRPK